MTESAEPLLYQTLVPSHYDVYLHREDYDRLAGIFPRIRDEARRALADHLERMVKKSAPRFRGFRSLGPSHWKIWRRCIRASAA